MSDHEREDARVIRDVLAGDRERYAVLVRAHQGKVLSLCLSLLRDRSRAEDAAQEIFLKAYQHLKSFRFDSSFSTWLYRISYRHCLDLIKAEKKRRAEPLDLLPEPPAAPPGEEPGAVDDLLSALPADYRLVLILREVQGLTYEEMSRAMDASLDAVKARLKRARRALQASARHLLEGADVSTGGGKR